MIENALREASGRVSGAKGAAEILGMPRQTLESKMKRLGIVPHRFKGLTDRNWHAPPLRELT